MVDDCLDKEEQERYLQGMRSFPDVMRSLTGKSFSSASAGERSQMLSTLEQRLDEQSGETKTFYNITKSHILQGYMSSKHFLTEVKPYQLVPGPDYRGCVAVGDDSKTLS
jgi:hypothetical protein